MVVELVVAAGAPETHYLANKPDGIVFAWLVISVAVFYLAFHVSALTRNGERDWWRALISVGLLGLALALLKPF